MDDGSSAEGRIPKLDTRGLGRLESLSARFPGARAPLKPGVMGGSSMKSRTLEIALLLAALVVTPAIASFGGGP